MLSCFNLENCFDGTKKRFGHKKVPDGIRPALGGVQSIVTHTNLVTALVFFGVSARRGAGQIAEGANEMGVVRETGQLAGLLDTDSLLQQLTGPEYPAVDDIFHDGEAGCRLENAAQIVFADKEF